MAHRARERAPGKKRARTKRRPVPVQGPLTRSRSLARSFASALYTQGEREWSERASERARVHYDSCIYIRSKNIHARAVCAGGPRPVFHLRIIF